MVWPHAHAASPPLTVISCDNLQATVLDCATRHCFIGTARPTCCLLKDNVVFPRTVVTHRDRR